MRAHATAPRPSASPPRGRGHAAALAALACGLASGCGATQVVDRADDGRAILIRTPQPDEDDLEALARAHGVRTVLNLRGEREDEGWFERERRGVERVGAAWVHLRVSGRSAPSDETVARFLDLVEDPAAWPIVMHCQGGIHRTGLLAALYRMQYQGWSAERAIAEMEDLWFDWTVTDREALKRWLRAYRRDPARSIPRSGPAEAGRARRADAAEPGAPP